MLSEAVSCSHLGSLDLWRLYDRGLRGLDHSLDLDRLTVRQLDDGPTRRLVCLRHLQVRIKTFTDSDDML